MTRVESLGEHSELDKARVLHEESFWCECEDETLSPAQEMWVERQRKIRVALANMMRCLVAAGARVARWDLVCDEDVEVFLWDDENNISLRHIHPSLHKLLTHQVISENTNVPYTPPWSNLIDAAIQIATPVPSKPGSPGNILDISPELIVPEPNGPVRHTTTSSIQVPDVEDGVQMASKNGSVPTSTHSSLVFTMHPEENPQKGKGSYSLVPITPTKSQVNAVDPKQHNTTVVARTLKSKKYYAGSSKGPLTGTHVLDLQAGKRSRMRLVDRATLKQMISCGSPHLLQKRISRLLPIAPRPSTTIPSGSNVRVLQIKQMSNWQNTQSVAVSVQADAPMEVSNANSEEIPRAPISSCSSASGLETDEAGVLDDCDKREHNFKFLGVRKIFPSLAVVVKPQLRAKERARSSKLQEKTALGNAVNLLISDQSKLMEWLIQKKLVPSSQVCEAQSHISGSKYARQVFLRLAKCSDVTRFPHSGGYIWFCELCQPSHVVPVIRGSIFEAACDIPPGELLQLILHWASYSGLHTFKEEMEVRVKAAERLRDLYKLLRAVCTATLQRQVQIGGEDRRVEIGIVSLGTVGREHTERQVKVEILGVMDVENKQVRLLSVKPLQEGEKNCKARFAEILNPLPRWLHKGSLIVTDYSIDADALRKLGYEKVKQVPCNSDTNDSNVHVMMYLKNVIPVIFQHTLPLFSQPMIQQFLDELAWREHWGWRPCLAYNTILQHIAFLTQKYSGNNFVKKLREIAANPFKEWISLESRETTRDSLNAQIQPSVLDASPGTSWKGQDLSTSSSKSAGPMYAIQSTVNAIERTNEVICTSDESSPQLLESSCPMTSSPAAKKACLSLVKSPLTTSLSKVSKRRAILESNTLQQKCIECAVIISEGHFTPTARRCLRCKFSSHCRSASGLHFAVAHKPIQEGLMNHPRRTRRGLRGVRPLIGDPRIRKSLPSASGHCLCGFQSDNGDYLAEHLVMCNYSTIYMRDLPPGTDKFE